MVWVDRISRAWVTPSFGSPGPDFINIAVQISTDLGKKEIKEKVISQIEQKLKRVRNSDKNAPRTIDLDIILFNGELVDTEIWRRPYVALPVAELAPNLVHPGDNRLLHEIAGDMQQSIPARLMENFPFG
jgi:2-amino-4-hydroxy-6-hydroxymethyldihydropteridine diphosphokinase